MWLVTAHFGEAFFPTLVGAAGIIFDLPACSAKTLSRWYILGSGTTLLVNTPGVPLCFHPFARDGCVRPVSVVLYIV